MATAITAPIAMAARSPQLQWRDPIYIAAGFFGIAALAILLVQPLLASRLLPNLSPQTARRIHRWSGGFLVVMVVLHVAGLWITSPPDVLDVLLFRSPTPFSDWGTIAMWAVFASAVLAALRRRVRLRIRIWRMAHTSLAVVIVIGSVVHAMLIEGTMETWSKAALCALILAALVKVVFDLKVWVRRVSSAAPK